MLREEALAKIIMVAIAKSRDWLAIEDTEEGHLDNYTKNWNAHIKTIKEEMSK